MSLKCNMTPERREEAFEHFDFWIFGEEEEAARECFDPILFYESLPRDQRRYWCTACRHTWEEGRKRLGGKHKDEVTCRYCQRSHQLLNVNKYQFKMSSLRRWVHTVFVRTAEDGALLIAAGLLQRRFCWDDLFGELDWLPKKLYYMKPGELQGWEADWGNEFRESAWRPTPTVREPFQRTMNYTYDGSYFVIGAEQIERSAFRYCRLQDYYLLGEEVNLYHELRETSGVVKYLAAYAMYPSMEIAERLMLFEAMDDLICTGKKNARLLNWEGRTPAEFLRMSKADAKLFVNREMEFGDLEVWRRLAKDMTFCSFAEASYQLGGCGAFEMVKKIADDRGIDFRDAAKYIKKHFAGDLAQIDKEKKVRLWRDYLDMAQQLAYDLEDWTVLMPKNLLDRHDAAAQLIEYRKHEAEEKQYADLYKRLCKKFSFSMGGLTVVVPKTSMEIVAEGKTLHHCVGGYAARHLNGKTVILFIRKSRRPERSFLTVELSTDKKPRIRQVHGYRNEMYRGGEHHDPEEAYDWFLSAWLGWVRAGSKRDKQGNPILKQEVETA